MLFAGARWYKAHSRLPCFCLSSVCSHHTFPPCVFVVTLHQIRGIQAGRGCCPRHHRAVHCQHGRMSELQGPGCRQGHAAPRATVRQAALLLFRVPARPSLQRGGHLTVRAHTSTLHAPPRGNDCAFFAAHGLLRGLEVAWGCNVAPTMSLSVPLVVEPRRAGTSRWDSSRDVCCEATIAPVPGVALRTGLPWSQRCLRRTCSHRPSPPTPPPTPNLRVAFRKWLL